MIAKTGRIASEMQMIIQRCMHPRLPQSHTSTSKHGATKIPKPARAGDYGTKMDLSILHENGSAAPIPITPEAKLAIKPEASTTCSTEHATNAEAVR